jgi:hypothetical protein
MDISIEFVFLFACALFVLNFIISGCGYTNVEGLQDLPESSVYECGSCPWSTAKCPDNCRVLKKDKCGIGGLGRGAKYECSCNAGPADSAILRDKSCVDTGSATNLDIGILDLRVAGPPMGSQIYKSYMHERPHQPLGLNADEGNKWVEHTTIIEDIHATDNSTWKFREKQIKNIVKDIDKLELLSKLSAKPYYIQNIRVKTGTKDHHPSEIAVKTSNHDEGKHFYFSDREGEVFCLSVQRGDFLPGEDFPHTVKITSGGVLAEEPIENYIQRLGHTKSKVPFC